MQTCNVCKQEIEPGKGLHAWNMITGFQAYIHEECQRDYEHMGSWCRMEVHQECSGVVYFGNEELPCECECHQKKAEIVAECDDCGRELTRDEVAYHDMESDTGAWHYYCSDCAPGTNIIMPAREARSKILKWEACGQKVAWLWEVGGRLVCFTCVDE